MILFTYKDKISTNRLERYNQKFSICVQSSMFDISVCVPTQITFVLGILVKFGNDTFARIESVQNFYLHVSYLWIVSALERQYKYRFPIVKTVDLI